MRPLTVVIADDEAPARHRIRDLLRERNTIRIVGECKTGTEAVEAVRGHGPDLLFLDVQMPGLSGLDVLREIGPDTVPAIVFATAYDEYALRAFEAHAIDYLLKPFDDERFEQTLSRVHLRLEERQAAAFQRRLKRLLEGWDSAQGPSSERGGFPASDPQLFAAASEEVAARIPVRKKDVINLLDPGEVTWVEAAGDYVRIHTKGANHLVRTTMAEMETRLDPLRFLRIHRSYIVRLDAIERLVPRSHGDHDAILTDGTSLRMSRSHRDHALRRLGIES